MNIIVYIALALFVVGIIDGIATELTLTWKGLTGLGMQHSISNMALLFYCRFEAGNYVTMNELRKKIGR